MSDVKITGDAKKLARIARDLRETGEGDLRKELLRAIRKAARSAIPDVRAAALTHLPKGGGLAARVASQKYGTRSLLSSSTAKVKITGSGMKELDLIDGGAVRHPTFARRLSLFSANPLSGGATVGRRAGEWHTQTKGVTSGFFSDTLSRKGPEVRREIEQAMRDIERKIEEKA